MDRPLPAWYDDAKFGIFVHWTAAAVPAFAPVTDSPFDLAAEHGWADAMTNSPYVEWYQNSLAIDGARFSGTTPRRTEICRTTRSWRNSSRGSADGTRCVGRPVRGRGREVRRVRHEAPRRRDAVAKRASQPAQEGLAVRTRRGRRAGRGRARPRHALRYVLLGRARLDVRRVAHARPRRDDRGDPTVRGVPRLRERALARAHRALRAVRDVERHRLSGGGRLAGAVSRTTSSAFPTVS